MSFSPNLRPQQSAHTPSKSCVWFYLGLLLAAALPTLSSPPAQAAQHVSVRRLLRPSTKSHVATFGIGPSLGVTYSGTSLQMEQTLGFHFQNQGRGPMLSLVAQESFGNGLTMQIGPRFAWDFQLLPRYGFYLSPYMQIGYLFATEGGDTGHGFNMQFGFEPKLNVHDLGLFYARLFAVNLVVGGGVHASYDIQFGAGVTF